MVRKAGRRGVIRGGGGIRGGGAIRAALGAATAAALALAGTQTALAGAHAAGTGWVLQTLPAPASSFDASLSGVSCASADACMAVGSFGTTKGDVPFAEAWNGTSWTPSKLPAPAPVIWMYGVSCPSPSSCIAVGATYSPQTNYTMPLAEVWNGISWSSQSPPLPPGDVSASLNADSCTSPSRCVAVGDGTSGAFSESWNGTTWTPSSAPGGGSSGEFQGVSCRSFRSCEAVGKMRVSSGFGPMAASWNGRSWTVESVPSPSGPSTDTQLESVSCNSATACMAVGTAGGPGAFQTLAEQRNGTAWTILSMPRLGGAKAAVNLAGVSCPRATRCTAVGNVTIRRKLRLLAEHWNGTRWKVDSTAEPPNIRSSAFGGVSCLAGRACIAVGSYLKRTEKNDPLAEQHS